MIKPNKENQHKPIELSPKLFNVLHDVYFLYIMLNSVKAQAFDNEILNFENFVETNIK